MAFDGALSNVRELNFQPSENADIRTCPDVELGEQCEDQCYLGRGHGDWNKLALMKFYPP